MATIKAIKASSVHQIQSGQVIVDLNSVAKELVENSLDAGASSIEVRFKDYGLDSIEVQDNGKGIATEDFDSIALKHHTSKLESYDDLDSLNTFGFRGEALSSLCALSDFRVVTATAGSGAKGSKLDFDVSGRMVKTSMVAAPQGTTVTVEKLFKNLPVRRRELEKNIKREYAKVLSLLQAYAAISTNVKFAVWNTPAKGKKTSVFATQSNTSTANNIANIHGAKTLQALLELDLVFELKPSSQQAVRRLQQPDRDLESRQVRIKGHISKPVFGEGRQAPDRQTFFVNSRPCLLPQVSKAINEVYKAFNVSQSPFIFANLLMDTNSYDVNVSPDKRTILLHDQTELLESLKEALTGLFEAQEHTVPATQLPTNSRLMNDWVERHVGAQPGTQIAPVTQEDGTSYDQSLPHEQYKANSSELMETSQENEDDDHNASQMTEIEGQADSQEAASSDPPTPVAPKEVQDFNARLLSQQLRQYTRPTRITTENVELNDGMSEKDGSQPQEEGGGITKVSPHKHRAPPGPVQNAFDRMRPKRTADEVATITIGDQTTSMVLESGYKRRRIHTPSTSRKAEGGPTISSLWSFAAPGTGVPPRPTHYSEHEDDADADSAEEDEDADMLDGDHCSNRSHSDSSHSASDSEPVDTDLFVEAESSDDEYLDEDEKKAREERRVAKLIKAAEEAAAQPTEATLRRASHAFRSNARRKDATLDLLQLLFVETSTLRTRPSSSSSQPTPSSGPSLDTDLAAPSAEAKLSLTISKSDFNHMRIIGQFNLGFILAVRPPSSTSSESHLFIIDQHAADEKANFERLSATTVLAPQRLVTPLPLSLGAVEAELVQHHEASLKANGFDVAPSDAGGHVLLSLPTSKDTTFSPTDLDELLHLLSEAPGAAIVRPSRVRRMLAMRACRASIMVGKALTGRQMKGVVAQMGGMDKPWNCPHGRPTMRHLAGLGGWRGLEEERVDWRGYVG